MRTAIQGSHKAVTKCEDCTARESQTITNIEVCICLAVIRKSQGFDIARESQFLLWLPASSWYQFAIFAVFKTVFWSQPFFAACLVQDEKKSLRPPVIADLTAHKLVVVVGRRSRLRLQLATQRPAFF